MFFYRKETPGLAIYSYLIGDEQTKEGVVIDPVRDVEDYFDVAKKNGITIKHVLETHVHADFVSGSVEIKGRLGDKVTLHCSGMGGKEWTPAYADHIVSDGDTFTLGGLRFRAIHTPGHTPEHIVWELYDESVSSKVPQKLFSGDFIFVGSVGRPDLLGEKEKNKLAHQLYQSIFEKITSLPNELQVLPTHGAGSFCGKAIKLSPTTTIGEERASNQAFQLKDKSVWVEELMRDMPQAPPYFSRMKKINVTGPSVLGKNLPGMKPLTPEQLIKEDIIILDIRAVPIFSAGFIPKSINIAMGPFFSTWAGWVLSPNQPIALVLDESQKIEEVIAQLTLVGFDRILGYLEGGIAAWKEEGHPLDTIALVKPDQVNHNTYPYILDVRTDNEWDSGHIEWAKHIVVGDVSEKISEIPTEDKILVTCARSYRASIIASLLKKAGASDVSNLEGGMSNYRITQS